MPAASAPDLPRPCLLSSACRRASSPGSRHNRRYRMPARRCSVQASTVAPDSKTAHCSSVCLLLCLLVGLLPLYELACKKTLTDLSRRSATRTEPRAVAHRNHTRFPGLQVTQCDIRRRNSLNTPTAVEYIARTHDDRLAVRRKKDPCSVTLDHAAQINQVRLDGRGGEGRERRDRAPGRGARR